MHSAGVQIEKVVNLVQVTEAGSSLFILAARELFLKVTDREYPRITLPCPTRQKVHKRESYMIVLLHSHIYIHI